MNLKRITIISLMLFTCVPMIIFVMLISGSSVGKVRDSNIEILKTLAFTNGIALEEFITTRDRELHLMTSRGVIINELQNQNSGMFNDQTRENSKDAMQALYSWIDSVSQYVNVWLVDRAGNIILPYDSNDLNKNISKDDLFERCIESGETIVGDITKASESQDYQTQQIFAPVFDSEGRVIGAIVLFTAMEFFQSFIETVEFGDTGNAILVDSNNKIIYHRDKTLIGMVLDQNAKEGISIASEKRYGGRLTTYVYNTAISGKIYVAEYNLKGVDWVILVTQNYAEVGGFTKEIGVSGLVVTVLFGLLAAIFATIITGFANKPLMEFNEVLIKSKEDEQFYHLPDVKHNELWEFAQNYNAMTDVLSNKYFELTETHMKQVESEYELRENFKILFDKERLNSQLMFTDTLTKLPNRAAFRRHLTDMLAAGNNGGIVYIDLDNFKAVNDLLGHSIGDEILRKVGEILAEPSTVEIEICARLNSDEFAVVIPSYQREIEIYCKRILERFQSPIKIGEAMVYVTASMGITMFPSDGTEIDALSGCVDLAMFQAKELGRNTYYFYDDALRYKKHRQNQILEILRRSVENEELFLVFQPVQNLTTGKVMSFEALLRVKNRHLGYISPVEFIPIAESNGLILPMGYWAIERACIFTQSLIENHGYEGSVSVNISPIQILEHNFVQKVAAILERTGLPPNKLLAEIKESVFIINSNFGVQKLVQLRELGVNVVLDNFGTTFSSLNCLTTMPIEAIKIAKSFVDGMMGSENKQLMVKTIIELSHQQGISVIAEGIEAHEQKAFFKESHGDGIQGFVYKSPLDEKAAKLFIEEQSH